MEKYSLSISLLIFTLSLGTFYIYKSHNSERFTTSNYASPPPPLCYDDKSMNLLTKFKNVNSHLISECFDHDITYLIDNDLLMKKAAWLKRNKGSTITEEFLLDALFLLGSEKTLHLMLAEVYMGDKRWHDAQKQLDLADIEINHKYRLWVDAHTGELSDGTDEKLLPNLQKNTEVKHAQVFTQNDNNFSLQRISDGDITKQNVEPSIATSSNGQYIWLTWTDSGIQDENQDSDINWVRTKSAQSNDAGNSWSSVDFNPLPHVIERYHFDPMTIYDETNHLIYAGGALVGFEGVAGSSNEDDSFFIYRWDLNTDNIYGPFSIPVTGADKGWLSVDQNGQIFLTHQSGIESSLDYAENFIQFSHQFFISGGPRNNYHDNDCLFITAIYKVATCDHEGSMISVDYNFSSIFNSPVFNGFAPDGILPGNFRVHINVQNAIHPNGEIHAIYTDSMPNDDSKLAIFMRTSDDNGLNWSEPSIISANASGDQFMPWVEIDKSGGIHVVYFDTRHGNQADDAEFAMLDLYYQYSDDQGMTWQETRVTPTSFIPPEPEPGQPIWMGQAFIGDYIAMNVTDNHINIAFPWSDTPEQMHLYFAQKTLKNTDVIFINSFE